MRAKKRRTAENALQRIATKEGKTVEQVRKDVNMAMLIGMCNPDPKVQAYWQHIPCEGAIPTPEEVISFLANKVSYHSS